MGESPIKQNSCSVLPWQTENFNANRTVLPVACRCTPPFSGGQVPAKRQNALKMPASKFYILSKLNSAQFFIGQLICSRWQKSENIFDENRKWGCYHSALIGLARMPMPSISISTISPSFIQRGGLRPWPTPDGVPMITRSPGSSVKALVI